MGIIDLLFPRRCLNCSKVGGYICDSCLSRVKRQKLICPMCEKLSIDGVTHAKCIKPRSLDGLISFWVYEGIVRLALVKLKYKFAYEIASEIVSNLVPLMKKEFFLSTFSSNVLMVPLPAHRLRKNWRGFNQTEIIGKMLAESMGWGYNSNVLFRKKNVKPQTILKAKERVRNIRGVFGLRKDKKSLNSVFENVILFDDVWTTGSTMKEAGKVLKRNGFKKVWGLTIAR